MRKEGWWGEKREKGVGGNEHDRRGEEGGKGLRRKKENRRKI